MRIKTEEGVLLNTDKSKASYQEDTRFDGSNLISVNTGSQWNHETLYLSAKGVWYLLEESDWQGSSPSAHFISDEAAATWLLLNGKDLPARLARLQDVVES